MAQATAVVSEELVRNLVDPLSVFIRDENVVAVMVVPCPSCVAFGNVLGVEHSGAEGEIMDVKNALFVPSRRDVAMAIKRAETVCVSVS